MEMADLAAKVIIFLGYLIELLVKLIEKYRGDI